LALSAVNGFSREPMPPARITQIVFSAIIFLDDQRYVIRQPRYQPKYQSHRLTYRKTEQLDRSSPLERSAIPGDAAGGAAS
jgi:hypothetical protein